MKNLVRRSRFSGYKGFDRIGREAKRNIREFTDTNTKNQSTMAATDKAVNPLIGDNYFTENPDKVLGTQYIDHGRFGNEIIKVDGSIDAIQKIDVPQIKIVDLFPQQEFATENKEDIIQQVFENEKTAATNEKLQKLRSPIKKSKKEVASTNLVGTQEIYTFREVSELYNKDISRDEMEAYYFTHPELNYKLLIDEFTNSKDDLIEKGLICWDNGKFVYVYTYQSGNISKKIASLNLNKEKLVTLTSERQYDRQLKFLQDVQPKAKGLVGDDRLIMLPHSDFAKSIEIHELRGKPELNSNMSLTNAFKRWLMAQPPDVFDKSNYSEIIEYYLNGKEIPIDKKNGKSQQIKDEKKAISIRQRTKEEGDALFGKFLAEDLLPEDQAKVSYLWNEKFNAFAEPNLSKTPISLQMSKTWKAGAPFTPNATQRQAVAFMQEKKSGLLAYGVGVGKSQSAILCAAQAHYNGFCNKPMFVVPTNTYDNWIAEIQGKMDKDTGTFIQGTMPQLPPVVGLFNLNPMIVKDKLKIYSKQDEKEFQHIEDIINMIRKWGTISDFTKDQVEAIKKIHDININAIRSQYQFLIAEKEGKGTGRAKNLVEYVINYLKDEYNYLIYDLGEIKDFPAGTIFVTTENGLQRLGVSDKNKDKLKESLFEILSQGEKTADAKRAKEVAGLELVIEQRISSSMKNAKLNLEDLFIDWVCFDEAHYYKKLFTYVKGNIQSEYEDKDGNTKYKRDKSKYELKSGAYPSGRALSAYVVSHYIQMMNDNRNVVCLTATPFTNSPLEVYSMMVLTNFKALQEMGLANMVEFFDTFMKINYDIKYTPQKTVKKDVVLTGYNNLSNLRQVIYSMMDKKDEGANLKRPVKLMYPSLEKGIETTIPMTIEQEELIAQVKDYINEKIDLSDVCQESFNDQVDELDFDGLEDEELIAEWEKNTNKDYEGDRDHLSEAKRESLSNQIKTAIKNQAGTEFTEGDLEEEESLGVRCLRGISLMRQITLSPYLYHKACSKVQKQAYHMPNYKDFINTSPKLKYTMGCIKSVIDFHKERGEKISGQVIYMAQGTEYFPLVKEYLVKEFHLKESQVGIVSGGMSSSAKENVKRQFLNGDCLVLIGSSTISVGVNLQDNATVLYNLWYDWNPTDAAQIEGRIWRQGNRFAFVRIVYPQCFNSADPVIFEYLNAKTLRINEIWNRSSEIQELDLKDFNPKELQKKLITDPVEKAEWEILETSDRINGEILYYENRRDLLVNAITSFKQFTKLKPQAIKEMNEIASKRATIKKEDAIKRNGEKRIKITEEFANDPAKMVEELTKFNEASKYDYAADPEGKYAFKDYNNEPNVVIYEDAKRLADYISALEYRQQELWGDTYWNRTEIADTLKSMRNYYRDMQSAEERVLKPMGLSFDSATNPIKEFDAKLEDLTNQLNEVEDGKEEKIERYKREYKESLKTLKTVEDRIAEFASANERLLPPQLNVDPSTAIEPKVMQAVAAVAPQEVVEQLTEAAVVEQEVVQQTAAQSKEEFFELPHANTVDEVEQNVNAILKQYSGRTMAAIQVKEYLSEIGQLGKDYVKTLGDLTQKDFDKFIAAKQSKLRSGKGKERAAAINEMKEEKANGDVDAILKMALAAGEEMEQQIAAQSKNRALGRDEFRGNITKGNIDDIVKMAEDDQKKVYREIYDAVFQGRNPEDMSFEQWRKLINEYRQRTGSTQESESIDRLNYNQIIKAVTAATPLDDVDNEQVSDTVITLTEPVFNFMSDSPMHQGKAISVLTKKIKSNGQVMPTYEWVEKLPAGLKVESAKIYSSKSEKGYTDKMVIGDFIVSTKAEQDYYKYLQDGGESYSAYLEKKKAYDAVIKSQKDAERKIADEKRSMEQVEMRKNAKVAKDEMIKSLILDGKQPLIDKSTKHFKQEIENRSKARQTAENKEEIGRLEMYIEQATRQADGMFKIATELYYIDENGNVRQKYNWQPGDSVLYMSNAQSLIKTKIASVRENNDDTVSYKVEPAEGIYNLWIGYDGLFPVNKDQEAALPVAQSVAVHPDNYRESDTTVPNEDPQLVSNIPEEFEPFADIVRQSDSVEEAIKKASQKKDVPMSVAKAFRDKYDPDRTMTPQQAFGIFYDEVKAQAAPVTEPAVSVDEANYTNIHAYRGVGEVVNETYGGVSDEGMGTFYTNNYDMAGWFAGIVEYNGETDQYENTGDKKGIVLTKDISFKNPYIIDSSTAGYDSDNEMDSFQLYMNQIKSMGSAKHFRSQLEREGHDGIILKDCVTNYYGDGTYDIYITFDKEAPVVKPAESVEQMQQQAADQNQELTAELINNQIEALTLAREYADEDQQAEIDSQVEALKITLNYI